MCWLSMSAISTAGGRTGRLVNARLVRHRSAHNAIPVATSLRRQCSVGSITSTTWPHDQPDGDFAPYRGYMLMADPVAALRETRRVLRDSGRLVFSVWADPQRNLWASIPGRVLVERGHIKPPEPGAPGIFAMADPGRLRTLVMDAGFAGPES